MKMERKYVIRRRVVLVVILAVLIGWFSWATQDVCYVGKGGNAVGYGSCSKMIDKVSA
jgi:hypothetical protein